MSKTKLFALALGAAFFALQPATALDLPSPIKDYLQTQHLDEGGALPFCTAKADGAGNNFGRYVQTNWQAMLDNVATIAPKPLQQQLIIRALEWVLSGQTYLDALNKLCDLKAKGVVSDETIDFAIDGRYPQIGLLSQNYQNPAVVKLVKRLELLLPKDDKDQGILADILSGKEKPIDEERAGIEGQSVAETLPTQKGG